MIKEMVGKQVTVCNSTYSLRVAGILQVWNGGNKPLYKIENNGSDATFMENDVKRIDSERHEIVLRG